MNITRILAIVVVVVLLIAGFMSVFTINERQQGIVLQFGAAIRPVTEPGLHFMLPWQNVAIYEKRIMQIDGQPEQVTAADQKRLVVDAFALYRIVDALQFRNSVLTVANAESQLQRILTSSLRETIGTVTLVDVVSGEREALMEAIRFRMNQAARQYGVAVVDVRIKRTDLPKENSEAIFRRMETERQREAAEIRAQGEEQALRIRAEADRTRTVLISEAQRQAEITRGQGDGEVVRIFAASFGQDVEFFTFYRTMQAYRTALNSDDTTMLMSPDGDFLRYLNSFRGFGTGEEQGIRGE